MARRPFLCKVTVGRDEYLGTPEEVVAWMARAQGAPAGGVASYMQGVAARVAAQGRRGEVYLSSPLAFLESLAAARWIRLERRHEPSEDRVDPQQALGDGPVAFGDDVSPDDLEDLL
ncbi:MAG: hypothetical protein IT460_03370 [Planctomycetes bacterium]|nr:hypothetical protein [Planctomycetota bacterium]